MSTKDGGPAFPALIVEYETLHGMSLRDWFAGLAMQAVITAVEKKPTEEERYKNEIRIANECYQMADIMLARRKIGL